MRRFVRCGWILGWSLVLASGAAAARQPAETPKEAKAEAKKPEVPEPKRFVSEHTGRFGGREVRYRVVAGETYLHDEKGEPTASLFTFAYLAQGVDDLTRRPVTFVWNGGPGSSSVWLHMGTFGPRRVDVPSDASQAGPPPYPIVDNPDTVLDLTDLVFVDPVGTGFSHALGSHENKEFWGLSEDAHSIAELIRTWITENGRWGSPKYLAGESFGTTRAAAVAGLLERGDPVAIRLNGLVLVSQALDYQGSSPAEGNFMSFVTYLPTMAATAWYHGRVKGANSLEELLRDARAFAYDEYAPALLRGSGLDPEQRRHIRDRLAYFTGLDPGYIERSDLRIIAWRFLKELLRDEGHSVGRLDGRYVGDDIDDVAELPEGDAASYAVDGAYTAALHQYMASELQIDMDRPYAVSAGMSEWRWRTEGEEKHGEPSYVDVTHALAVAMHRNAALRVLLASGYYDFATPFFDGEITFARHGIVPERVTMTYYEAGHMMYLHAPSRQRFLADVRAFYEAGTPVKSSR